MIEELKEKLTNALLKVSEQDHRFVNDAIISLCEEKISEELVAKWINEAKKNKWKEVYVSASMLRDELSGEECSRLRSLKEYDLITQQQPSFTAVSSSTANLLPADNKGRRQSFFVEEHFVEEQSITDDMTAVSLDSLDRDSPIIMEDWMHVPAAIPPSQLSESKEDKPVNQLLTTKQESLRQFQLMYGCAPAIQTPAAIESPKHIYNGELELRYKRPDNIPASYVAVPLYRIESGLPIHGVPNVTSLEWLPPQEIRQSLLNNYELISEFPRIIVADALSQVLKMEKSFLDNHLKEMHRTDIGREDVARFICNIYSDINRDKVGELTDKTMRTANDLCLTNEEYKAVLKYRGYKTLGNEIFIPVKGSCMAR